MDSRCYEKNVTAKAFRPLFVVKERTGGESLRQNIVKREEGPIDY